MDVALENVPKGTAEGATRAKGVCRANLSGKRTEIYRRIKSAEAQQFSHGEILFAVFPFFGAVTRC